MRKRLIAFLCILSLLMTNVIPAYATEPVDSKAAESTEENKTISDSFTFVNPVYADQITEEELEKELAEIEKEEKKDSSKTRNTEYISDLNILAETIREKMIRRETNVSVNYMGTSYEGVPKEIVYMAMAETGVATEGDYLLFQYGGYKCSISGTVEGDTYYVTFDYTISYYTTWEQEEAVTETIEKVLGELGINGLSDYEKVCKIYDYICENVTYDYENLNDPDYKLKATAYAALINKTAVCQGYANLFYRMAREAGVDARIIPGTSGDSGHAWNIVKLDGTYYNLDSTWDAGRSKYDYFLKGTKDFDEANTLNDHTPDPEYLAEEFTSAYPIADTHYVLDERKELEDDFSISADAYLYTGKEVKPLVTSEKYIADADYKVTYENNIDSGTATVKITGINDYKGTITKEFQIVFFEYSFDQTGSNKIIIEEVSQDVTGHLEITDRVGSYAVIGIDDEAFKSCKKLTAITMPQTLTSIGMNAFNGCTVLTDVTSAATSLTIGNYAFKNCRALKNVTAADISTIGQYCFEGCNKLEKVSVRNSIKKIDDYAFANCMNLKEVEVGGSIIETGNYAFNQCYDLEKIGEFGSATSIGEFAFYQCESLKEIDLTFSNVKELKAYTFSGCISLKNAWLPDRLDMIGVGVFNGCKCIDAIEMPAWVTKIESGAFYGCENLKNIIIPEKVTKISSGTFAGCKKLEDIYFAGDISVIESGAFEYCESFKVFEIPEDVEQIGPQTFYACSGLEKVIIPDSVIEISDRAFWACTSLNDVVLPEYLEKLGAYVFSECTSLTSIVIPEYITEIPSNAFSGCTNLTSVQLSEELRTIRMDAFSQTHSLKEIEFPGKLTTIEQTAFAGTGVKSFTIPSNVEYIGTSAFGNAAWEMSVDWTDEIYFAKDVKKENISADAFNRERNILYVYKNTPMHDYAVENNYFYILIDGEGEDNLIKGTIGDTAEWQIDKASGKMTVDTTGNLPDGDSQPWYDYRIYVKSVEIKGNIREIGRNNFYDFWKLESITMPDTIAVINTGVFMSCPRLKSITLPEQLEAIWGDVFSGCNELKEIVVPHMVSEISANTFEGIKNLKRIVFRNKYFRMEGIYYFPNKDVVLCGSAGSSIEEYAKANGYTFEAIPEHEHDWLESLRTFGEFVGKKVTACTICGERQAMEIKDEYFYLENDMAEYTGNAFAPEVFSDELIFNVDYTVTYVDNINAGTGKAVITGIGNYTGQIIKTFTITPVDVNIEHWWINESLTYDGMEKTPIVGNASLVKDVDYTVSYSNNINAGEGTALVTITGIGNYTGTYEMNFTINHALINAPEVSIQAEYSSVEYDGMEKRPAVTVTYGSKVLKLNEDYILTYSGNTEPGWAVINIEGTGNYKGSTQLMFEITPPVEEPGGEEPGGEEPGGSEFIPEEVEGIEYLRVGINGAFGNFTIRKSGPGWSDEWETNGIEDDVIAGKTLADMGYTKVTDPIHADDPDKKFEGWMVGVKVLEKGYDGKEIYRWKQVKSEGLLTSAEIINYTIPKYHGMMFYAKWEGEEFPEWTEEVGRIRVGIQGNGGSFDVNSWDSTWITGGCGSDMLPGTTIGENGYEILSNPVHDENPDREFLGWKAYTIDRIIQNGRVEQVVNEVEGGGILSTEDIHDYVIPECEEFIFLAQWECEEHAFAGCQITPATMEASGEKTNECMDCGYKEYEEIPQIDTVTLSGTSYTYTGKAITTPKVTVKDVEGNKLTLNEDYRVAYSNNINAGKAKVTVMFMGNYAGDSVTKTFTIKPVNAAKLKASLAAASFVYNGKARKPAVTVKNASNVKLVNGKDYTVSYAAGRKNVGKYAVKITYKGNYRGTKTLNFTINPKGITIKSLTKGTKQFTVKWNKVTTQTTGYQIRYSTKSSMAGAKKVNISKNTTTSATVKKLTAKKKYYVQVRTYKTVNGTKYYSGWSAKKNVTVK